VNEKAPVAGSNAILETSPVAERVIVPPVPPGSLAETVKWSVPPTVAFWGPGTTMIGTWLDGATKTNVAVTLWIIPPLVPVMVRVYVDAVEEPHVTVAVPLLARLEEEIAPQFSPEGAMSVRATPPVSP